MKYVYFVARGYIHGAVDLINKLNWAEHVSHLLPNDKTSSVHIILHARDDDQTKHFKKEWADHEAREKAEWEKSHLGIGINGEVLT